MKHAGQHDLMQRRCEEVFSVGNRPTDTYGYAYAATYIHDRYTIDTVERIKGSCGKCWNTMIPHVTYPHMEHMHKEIHRKTRHDHDDE